LRLTGKSIINRITFYYARAIILLVVASLIFIPFGIRFSVNSIIKNNLEDAVTSALEDISVVNDILVLGDDFDTARKGTMLLLYSDDGYRLDGNLPGAFVADTILRDNAYTTVTGENESWIVYDKLKLYENGKKIWVRGIYNTDTQGTSMEWVVVFLIIFFSAFILIAIYMGYVIAENSLRPISTMIKTSEEISKSGDVNKRIREPDSEDELKTLGVTLNSMLDKLQELSEKEKRFSSDVAHELKTPVATMISECDYILSQNRSRDDYKDTIAGIKSQAIRMNSLISQMLTLTKSSDSKEAMQLEKVNVSELCYDVLEDFGDIAKEKNIAIKKEINDKIYIMGDELMLMRMIRNLIDNACKYFDEEKESFIRVKLEVDNNNNIKFKISDNGIGISKDDLPHIFDRLFKVDSSREHTDSSYGLGLSMVKWIVDAHDGKISVESKLGEGSEFVVELPCKFF